MICRSEFDGPPNGQKAIQLIQPGEVLEIVCTDPGSLAGLPVLAGRGGHELLAVDERDGLQSSLLRKGGVK